MASIRRFPKGERDTDFGWRVCVGSLERTAKAHDVIGLSNACISAQAYITQHNKLINTTAIARRKILLKYQRQLVALLFQIPNKTDEILTTIKFYRTAVAENLKLISNDTLTVDVSNDLRRWDQKLHRYLPKKSHYSFRQNLNEEAPDNSSHQRTPEVSDVKEEASSAVSAFPSILNDSKEKLSGDSVNQDTAEDSPGVRMIPVIPTSESPLGAFVVGSPTLNISKVGTSLLTKVASANFPTPQHSPDDDLAFAIAKPDSPPELAQNFATKSMTSEHDGVTQTQNSSSLGALATTATVPTPLQTVVIRITDQTNSDPNAVVMNVQPTKTPGSAATHSLESSDQININATANTSSNSPLPKPASSPNHAAMLFAHLPGPTAEMKIPLLGQESKVEPGPVKEKDPCCCMRYFCCCLLKEKPALAPQAIKKGPEKSVMF